MVTLTLSDQQIVDLVRQLSPVSKQAILEALLIEREIWWDALLTQNEHKLSDLTKQRGLDWNQLSEDERENFVDDLLHEKA